MPSQLFKEKIPLDILFNFLNSCSNLDNGIYRFGINEYKKAIFNDLISSFINIIKSYYYLSKQHYIERKMTYKHLITIIRQICNHMNIPYISKIVYNKSSYEIIYYISNVDSSIYTIANKQLAHNGVAF